MNPTLQNVTPHLQVNAVLHELLLESSTVLDQQFIGLYLYGSLALGDFTPASSDIDFLIVTANDLSLESVTLLMEMHRRLSDSGLKWVDRLEGSYLPLSALPRYRPDDPPRLCVNEGKVYMGRHGYEWILQRHQLREYEMTVLGPPIKPLIEPLSPGDLRQAIGNLLTEWWLPMLSDSSRLEEKGYRDYAVLSMCRALYTLEFGALASKRQSAKWALKALGREWQPVIETAIASKDSEIGTTIQHIHRLIRLAVDRSRHTEITDTAGKPYPES
jgi:hypothetical protein